MSLRKRIASFRFAINGLAILFSSQPNARVHLAVLVATIAAGLFFQIARMEWVAVVICAAMVLSLEAVNTAIEQLCDLVSPDYHPLVGKAKDVAAAAVLIAAIGAVVVGIMVFLPKILEWLPGTNQ